jgi:YD repeat-containing protein
MASAGGLIRSSYSRDAVGRLAGIGHDMAGTAGDVTFGFAYNPASQLIQASLSNSGYAAPEMELASRAYAVNGLNQYSSIAGTPLQYDANGNLTRNPDGGGSGSAVTYTYDVENRLVSASGGRTAQLCISTH